RLGGALGRDVAAGTAHVLDHDRLAPSGGKLVGKDAPGDVGCHARRKADQDADGLLRPVLLCERWRDSEPSHNGCGDPIAKLHRNLPSTGARSFRRIMPFVVRLESCGSPLLFFSLYSPLMFAALMIGHHFSISAF